MKKLLCLIVAIAILGIIVSGCSIPLKFIVPTSEKGNPKPELGTPTIEKITFIHYAKSSGHSKPVWDETQDDFKKIAGGVKWPSTVSYEINTDGSDLAPSSVISTLEASLEIWDLET